MASDEPRQAAAAGAGPATAGMAGALPAAGREGAAADRETLYRFFALPAAAAHDSWLLTFMPQELITASRRSRLGTLILSRLLLRHAQLPMPDRFELPAQHRWVLCDSQRLARAALRLGAFALGPQIAVSIGRDHVRVFRAALGDCLYREAVAASGSALAKVPSTASLALTTPEAVRSLAERIGLDLMRATLPDEALRSRLALKFPQEYSQSRAVEVSAIDTQAVAARIRELLQGD